MLSNTDSPLYYTFHSQRKISPLLQKSQILSELWARGKFLLLSIDSIKEVEKSTSRRSQSLFPNKFPCQCSSSIQMVSVPELLQKNSSTNAHFHSTISHINNKTNVHICKSCDYNPLLTQLSSYTFCIGDNAGCFRRNQPKNYRIFLGVQVAYTSNKML